VVKVIQDLKAILDLREVKELLEARVVKVIQVLKEDKELPVHIQLHQIIGQLQVIFTHMIVQNFPFLVELTVV